MTQGHGHAEKPQQQKPHEKPQHEVRRDTTAPNAFDKSLRGQQSQKQEKPQSHEKQRDADKQASRAAPNVFDKGVREKAARSGPQEHAKKERGDRRTSRGHEKGWMSQEMKERLQELQQKEQAKGPNPATERWKQIADGSYKRSPQSIETHSDKQHSQPNRERKAESKPASDSHSLSTSERLDNLERSKRTDATQGQKGISEQAEKPWIADQRASTAGERVDTLAQNKQVTDAQGQKGAALPTIDTSSSGSSDQVGRMSNNTRQENARVPNALDKSVRAQQKDGRKGDQVTSKHDQALSSQERAERQRIATPADGIGFQFGSAQLVPGTMEEWLSKQPESLRAALSDTATKVVITTTASRPGGEAYNMRLSEGRATAIQQWFHEQGVSAHLEINARGEEPAKQEGKQDGVDAASDRIAKIEVESVGEGGKTSSSISESKPEQPASGNISPFDGRSDELNLRTESGYSKSDLEHPIEGDVYGTVLVGLIAAVGTGLLTVELTRELVADVVSELFTQVFEKAYEAAKHSLEKANPDIKMECHNTYVREFATAVANLTEANPGHWIETYKEQRRYDLENLIKNIPPVSKDKWGHAQGLDHIVSTAHRDALSAVIQLGAKGVQEFRNKYPDYEARRQAILKKFYLPEQQEG